MKGRKRHIVVHTVELLLAVCVTPVHTPERAGAQQLPTVALRWSPASRGSEALRCLPKRWVVERTVGWLMKQRRLVCDYEVEAEHVEAWTYMAMIGIMVRRLA